MRGDTRLVPVKTNGLLDFSLDPLIPQWDVWSSAYSDRTGRNPEISIWQIHTVQCGMFSQLSALRNVTAMRMLPKLNTMTVRSQQDMLSVGSVISQSGTGALEGFLFRFVEWCSHCKCKWMLIFTTSVHFSRSTCKEAAFHCLDTAWFHPGWDNRKKRGWHYAQYAFLRPSLTAWAVFNYYYYY